VRARAAAGNAAASNAAAVGALVQTLAARALVVAGRGLHSFPFQLNLSSSVHRIYLSNS
jgi:hypothetical protein